MAAFHSYADGPVAHAAYRRAVLAYGPDHPDTLNLRALVELRQGDARRSLDTCLKAIKADPRSGSLWQCLGWVKHELGEHADSLAAYRRATLLAPEQFSVWPSLVWALDMSEYASPEQRLAVRADIERRFVQPLARTHRPHHNAPDPDRRLRIGYISADFFRHSAAFTFSLPLRGHDRERFEVVCYDASEHDADPMTQIMRASVDHWRPILPLDDDALASLIRSDQIDILIDLSGVTSGGRLMAMARRPAPVQITGWGYAPGLGLSYIDYLLSDHVLISPERQHLHAEQIMYLPALMAADIEAAGDPLPELTPRPSGRPPTFGYFGRVMKITDRMLGLWAQILQAVPDSRLILKMADCKDAGRRDRVIDLLIGLGVDGRRVEVRGETSRADHLAQHNDIDVALDSSPVGGGTTTLDATMMGVPTVTLLGDTVSGRVSASILTAIDYRPWIAESPEQYVNLAVRIAEVASSGMGPYGGWLSGREQLRQAFLDSIMCDRAAYTRALEEQYRAAWQTWCVAQQSSRHTLVTTTAAPATALGRAFGSKAV